MRSWLLVGVVLLLLPSVIMAQSETKLSVTITVDAGEKIGPFKPIYRFFGADEPNYAYMKDGRKLLADIGRLGSPPTYFRAHNLLTSGDLTPALKWGSTNVYTEDASGKPVYDFTTVDRIIDAYLSNGVRPFVQLGFMPEALSTRPQPYQHEWRPGLPYETILTGWAYPPKDYDKWRDLCAELTRHFVEKYGKEEVESWYFECWNEANGHYWKSTPQEWYKLHDYAIDGVRRALPTARVGGPHSAGSGGKFTRDFLEHCLRGTNHATGQTGTPLDFVAFHAKGSPVFVDGHVRMGIANQLQAIDNGFRMVSDFPELKQTPIILGESDPEGCAACQGPHLAYRNGTTYSSYTAASFARKHLLADKHGVNFEGAVTWAFEFEDQPYFAGQRVLATNGITLPVFNVFRMMAKMAEPAKNEKREAKNGRGSDDAGPMRLATRSTHEVPLDEIVRAGVRGEVDVAAMAVADGTSCRLLVWHYHDDDVPGPDAQIAIELLGLADGDYAVTEWRVDADHSNAYVLWQRAGSPVAPDADLYKQMQSASELAQVDRPAPDRHLTAKQKQARFTLTLPRQGVSLLVIEARR